MAADRHDGRHRPRLLSDNGPCYISQERGEYLAEREMERTRGSRTTRRRRKWYKQGYELKDEELIRPSAIRESVYWFRASGVRTDLATHEGE